MVVTGSPMMLILHRSALPLVKQRLLAFGVEVFGKILKAISTTLGRSIKVHLTGRMDVDSLDVENGTSFKSELDDNSYGNKDEQKEKSLKEAKEEEEMQDFADQEKLRSAALPVAVVSEGLQSPTTIPSSGISLSLIDKNEETGQHLPFESDDHSQVKSDSNDNVEKNSHSFEEPASNVGHQECHDEEQGTSGNNLSGDLHGVSADQIVKNERPLVDSSLLSIENDFNSQSEKSEFDNDVNKGGNVSHNMEQREDDHIVGVANLDDREPLKDSFVEQSLPTDRSPKPPTLESELSVHTEKSPDPNHSAAGEQLLNGIGEEKLARSPKHTPLEKHSVKRKRDSQESLSPPSIKSPRGRATHKETHHRDSSLRKKTSASPRSRESPRRKERSTSRSPVRRKDTSGSGHKRDRRGRSRSRSPYARDQHRRSPRRRHSPRYRSSPSYHSRHRSSRRPWSPPTNRNTGVGKPGRNLFVAGFSYVTTERDLEKKFSRFGRVTDVRIVRDNRSGDSRGFGFLSLERDEDADAAIRALDQSEWNGRIVLVEKSKTGAR
ncbi:serine/arginine repetitive matrix protein 1-like isoform X2 [Zingiber officinale]|uniref:serine/arginine repetitive matrix protein 1-like isoform X2 n=1 Tax=Zingiber officinale TaxID=94328 RepID=UPI001C4B6182|nr:serine/arginine repetitive matrix protein 1-like isoform X2 [Zingiber officinale]